jgi:hypothetical protein
VGARTLVAVERRDGRYDLHHSQWGGEHLDRLSTMESGDAPPELVDPEPIDTAVPVRRLLSVLDPRAHEAVVVVGETTESYLVCWLGIETSRESGSAPAADAREEGSSAFTGDATAAVSRTDDVTALVPWTDEAATARLRRFLRITKDTLGDAVDAGLVPAWLATAYLAVRLARHPASSDEALWLPDGVVSVE